MRHASFFSGVGGLDIGFTRAGMQTVSLSEIEPYACQILSERFPGIPNLGDITKLEGEEIPDAEIWTGGFPCQDLSLAGKRAGFDGERSVLAFSFLNLVERRRPRWLVLENVLGLFSSSQGRDFGRLLREMDELGYSVAWRTLDARYFGVAQRRRRVFIVASLIKDGPGQVLFECEGVCGHLGTSAQARQETSGGSADRAGVWGTFHPPFDPNRMRDLDGVAVRVDDQQLVENSTTVQTDPQRVGNFELYDFPKDSVAPSMAATRARNQIAYSIREDAKANNFSANEIQVANALQALWPGEQSHHAQTFIIGSSYDGYNQKLDPDGPHRTLRIGRDSTDFVVAEPGVAEDQLLPEGLDMHRYRVCGNGIAAPVAEWIARRIIAVNAVQEALGATESR
jgi:DNA-cytosine methyltransferase